MYLCPPEPNFPTRREPDPEIELMAQAFIAGLVFPPIYSWHSDMYRGCSRGCKYHACYIDFNKQYQWD